jgi:hypothetical protein
VVAKASSSLRQFQDQAAMDGSNDRPMDNQRYGDQNAIQALKRQRQPSR